MCPGSLNGDTARGEALQNSVGVPIMEYSFLSIEVTHHVQQTVSVHVFVFLYPEGNVDYAEAINGYSDCLTTDQTFATWTLESVAKAIKRHADYEWRFTHRPLFEFRKDLFICQTDLMGRDHLWLLKEKASGTRRARSKGSNQYR